MVVISVATFPFFVLSCTGNNGHRVNKWCRRIAIGWFKECNEMLYEFVNRSTHPVQPIVECLIRRKIGKPRKQIFFSECMYLFDVEAVLICSTEQIYSKQFLIGEDRICIVTESLAVELQWKLVNIADIHIYSYKF